ncbi:App1 family protein [Litoribacter populi]|uniref:App1 family protein n=1 Tax=Litoribacter populi TaxID=2598460 RepID=UPI00117D954C|nr:phosphatase domain-containing protein [Litoribacter populi]
MVNKSNLLRSAYFIKRNFALGKLWVGKKTGIVRKVMVLPFKGLGSKHEVFLIGRVIKDRSIKPAEEGQGRWSNFKAMYKRFMSWKIPNVRVKASFAGDVQTVVTDEEGYFEFKLQPKESIEEIGNVQTVELELLNKVVTSQGKVTAKGKVFIPLASAEFGIISDIDDTIVPTGATRWYAMFQATFFNNALTRLPFAGVGEFYKALVNGQDNKPDNPIFYVSSSPWNLYDFLAEFLEIHQIPKGPLMLRDIGLTREQFIAGSHELHKLTQIEHIFEVYPDMQFILIGDSGQKDPEIYLQAVRDFPGRVKRIYIRNVSSDRREEKVKEIGRELKKLGVGQVLVKDTFAAAQDALSERLIVKENIGDIKEKVLY